MTDEVMKQLDELMKAVADTKFDCGEWTKDASEEYAKVSARADAAEKALRDFFAAQLHQGEADRERLDWLEAVALERNVIASGIAPSSDTACFSVGLERVGGCDDFEGFSLRAAIDAAKVSVGSPAMETGNE